MKKFNKKLQGKSENQNPKNLREEEARLRQDLIDEKDSQDKNLISSEAFLKKLDDIEDKYQGYESCELKIDSLSKKLDELWKEDDIDFEEIDRIIDEQNNLQDEFHDLSKNVHSSDENFLEFVDLYLAREEVLETTFEEAPDELKEIILGKSEKIIVKKGIFEKYDLWLSNLFERITPQFLSPMATGNAISLTANRVLAGLSLSILFVTLLFLQNNPPIPFRGEASPLISIETANDKIVIKNNENNNIELILMNLDGKVLNQSILKDSINVIDPIKGTKSYKIIILSVETEATLVDTVINFD